VRTFFVLVLIAGIFPFRHFIPPVRGDVLAVRLDCFGDGVARLTGGAATPPLLARVAHVRPNPPFFENPSLNGRPVVGVGQPSLPLITFT
jgi:hypothetical protein